MVDGAEAVDTQTNGTPTQSASDAARAAFMSREAPEAAEAESPAKAPAGAAKPAPVVDPDDDDADLDGDDEDAPALAATDDEDPDRDLDEEDQAASAVDPDVAKRLEQVRRTDKRLREQRESQFAAREQQFRDQVEAIKPRLAKLEAHEALAARGKVAQFNALLADAGEDEIELIAKRAYAFTKAGKARPELRAAIEAMEKDRERDAEIKRLRDDAEAEKAEKKRAAEQAESDRHDREYVARVAKEATDKTGLVKRFLSSHPEETQNDLYQTALRITKQTGVIPTPREVLVAVEKHYRQTARRFGIDPKTISPAAAAAAGTTGTKPAPKTGDKKPAAPSAAKSGDDDKRSPRDKFISLNGKYD